jgi:hypothetical protein
VRGIFEVKTDPKKCQSLEWWITHDIKRTSASFKISMFIYQKKKKKTISNKTFLFFFLLKKILKFYLLVTK